VESWKKKTKRDSLDQLEKKSALAKENYYDSRKKFGVEVDLHVDVRRVTQGGLTLFESATYASLGCPQRIGLWLVVKGGASSGKRSLGTDELEKTE